MRVTPIRWRHSCSGWNGSESPFLRRLLWTGRRRRTPTLTSVVGHILVSDLADSLIRQLLDVCSACPEIVVSRSIPLNVDLTVSLAGINAANAAVGRQGAPAARDGNSATAEAEVTSLSVDQHDIARV